MCVGDAGLFCFDVTFKSLRPRGDLQLRIATEVPQRTAILTMMQ